MTDFAAIHNRLAPMQGYEALPPLMAQLRQAHQAMLSRFAEPRDRAFRAAFTSVRREVWDARESRLRATWESYG